eukprot:1954810-Prymnesium_polylepis.2
MLSDGDLTVQGTSSRPMKALRVALGLFPPDAIAKISNPRWRSTQRITNLQSQTLLRMMTSDWIYGTNHAILTGKRVVWSPKGAPELQSVSAERVWQLASE